MSSENRFELLNSDDEGNTSLYHIIANGKADSNKKSVDKKKVRNTNVSDNIKISEMSSNMVVGKLEKSNEQSKKKSNLKVRFDLSSVTQYRSEKEQQRLMEDDDEYDEFDADEERRGRRRLRHKIRIKPDEKRYVLLSDDIYVSSKADEKRSGTQGDEKRGYGKRSGFKPNEKYGAYKSVEKHAGFKDVEKYGGYKGILKHSGFKDAEKYVEIKINSKSDITIEENSDDKQLGSQVRVQNRDSLLVDEPRSEVAANKKLHEVGAFNSGITKSNKSLTPEQRKANNNVINSAKNSTTNVKRAERGRRLDDINFKYTDHYRCQHWSQRRNQHADNCKNSEEIITVQTAPDVYDERDFPKLK